MVLYSFQKDIITMIYFAACIKILFVFLDYRIGKGIMNLIKYLSLLSKLFTSKTY